MTTSAENNAKHEEQLVSMELFIGKSLRIGVLLSGAVIAIGLILLLLKTPAGSSAGTAYGLLQIWHGLLLGQPDAIIYLGLLLLILTPIFRVAASVVLFFYQRDFVYVAITSYVLGVLILSLLLGKAGG